MSASAFTDEPRAATIRISGRLVICSSDPRAQQRLAEIVFDQSCETCMTSTIDELKTLLPHEEFSVCILDEPHTAAAVADLERIARQHHQPTQFIVLPALGQRDQFRTAGLQMCEVLDPPMTREKLRGAVFTALGRSHIIAENQQLKRRLLSRGIDDMVGQGDAMLQLRNEIQQLADQRCCVLIIGEAGSGTNVAARALHRARFGSRKPVVRLRCSVLSGTAIEKELFGDASENDPGRLSQAAGGTLLLDDIDAAALSTQERLVRLLRDAANAGEDQASFPCVIATTHCDLQQAVREGRFRADLYELLCARTIRVPALRERMEDIGLLTEHFLAEYAAREGQPAMRLTGDGLEVLRHHHWPGNIRELNNVLERCCTITTELKLTGEMLRAWMDRPADEEEADSSLTLREMERKLIEATFNRFGGNREMTAKALQIGLRTLSGKLREYGYPPRGGPGSNRRAA
jgi:DNA-binding NtrC family response regulator